MRHAVALLAGLVAAAAALSPASAVTLRVTTVADDGPGSLRAVAGAARPGDVIALALEPGDSVIALDRALPPLGPGIAIVEDATVSPVVTIAGPEWPLAPGAGFAITLPPGHSVTFDIVLGGAADDRGLALDGGGTLVLARACGFGGGTHVAAATLRLGPNASLPPRGLLTLEGGSVALGDADAAVGGLAGPSGTVTIDGHSLTVDQDKDTVFGGTIAGSGRLIKAGEGRLVLEAPIAWTGGTTIAGGVLELRGAAGPMSFGGGLEVRGGALIAPGMSIGAGQRGSGAAKSDRR